MPDHMYIKQLTITFSVSTVLVFGSVNSIMAFASVFVIQFSRTGMGKEVENLIMENNELLATKYAPCLHCTVYIYN